MSGPRWPVALASPDPGRNRHALACDHDGRRGSLDESARRLTHEELAVGRQLASEGHRVSSMPEWPWLGPMADLDVCGQPVEVKSFLALPERPGGPPTAASVCNKLLRASRQADVAVLWCGGSGLSPKQAREGMNLFAAKNGWERMSSVRVLGDGFDLSWEAPSLSPERRRFLGGRQPAPAERSPEPPRRESPRRESPRRESPRRESPDLGVGL